MDEEENEEEEEQEGCSLGSEIGGLLGHGSDGVRYSHGVGLLVDVRCIPILGDCCGGGCRSILMVLVDVCGILILVDCCGSGWSSVQMVLVDVRGILILVDCCVAILQLSLSFHHCFNYRRQEASRRCPLLLLSQTS